MAVHTTHLHTNLLSNQSLWRETQEGEVKADAQPLESCDAEKVVGLGRILHGVGKGIKTGLLAHGLAMTSSKM